MDRSESVRQTEDFGFGVPKFFGDGLNGEQSVNSFGESPSLSEKLNISRITGSVRIFKYLSEHQIAALAVFCDVHAGDEVDVEYVWNFELTRVFEVVCYCSTCDALRIYPRHIDNSENSEGR